MITKYRKRLLYFYLIFMCISMFIIHIRDYNALDDFMDWSILMNHLKNGKHINIIPFRTIITYIQCIFELQIYHFLYIMLGNIAMFIPVGIFISKNDLKIIIPFIILKELIQFILNIGSFDIDTIILNFVGILLGVIMQKICYKYKITYQIMQK